MAQAGVTEYIAVSQKAASLRIADLLSKGIFGALLSLIVLTAIPYGTVEPWWKAVFACLVFALCIGAIVEGLLIGGLSRASGFAGRPLLLPLLTLAIFAFAQTISLGGVGDNPGNISPALWNTISADPFQTRFFVLQLLALILTLALLYRYASTKRRVRSLIYVILAVAVASAIFGILRQTTQHKVGYVLPLLKPDLGYGQFGNKNHFAFLMEMALGLGLGLILGGGVKRDRAMIFFAALLPIWTALVLSNSRGGILAMLSQLVIAALLFTSIAPNPNGEVAQLRFFKLVRPVALRLVLLIALVVGLLLGTLWVGGDRLVNTFEAARGELNPAASGSRGGATRNEIWRATWRMFTAHPTLGVGLGGYWVAITAYHDASGSLTPQEAHSDYLELLSSGGLVGVALLVWFAVTLIRLTRRNLKSADRFGRAAVFGAVIGIAGVAVHSLVDFGLHLMANALVFIVLIMIATAKIDS
jgi:O-antigen ligase